MQKAREGNKVVVHYREKMESGEVYDSSETREPLQFIIGEGQVITGLEQAVIGMEKGESKREKISFKDAYGPHLDTKVATVNKKKFPENIEPRIGQRLKVVQPDGTTSLVTVTDLSGSEVTLDANHPLAGKDIILDIKLVEVM
jgi:peptidylprolyl isomerase